MWYRRYWSDPMETFHRHSNFRTRTRIYPNNGYYPRYWGSYNSNISEIDQNITNFGTQTNVSQSAFVNQGIDIDNYKRL
jgi:hypothetical protein